MKALTICQPYAHLIMINVKPVENRTWYTHYRGPLAIHAGKSKEWMGEKNGHDNYGITLTQMAFGAVIAQAELVDCLQIERVHAGDYDRRYPWLRDHEHAKGPWCWVLEGIRPLAKPIPWKGAQGLWQFDFPEVLCA